MRPTNLGQSHYTHPPNPLRHPDLITKGAPGDQITQPTHLRMDPLAPNAPAPTLATVTGREHDHRDRGRELLAQPTNGAVLWLPEIYAQYRERHRLARHRAF